MEMRMVDDEMRRKGGSRGRIGGEVREEFQPRAMGNFIGKTKRKNVNT